MLGRRARNLGVQWLRTADLLVAGGLPVAEARAALVALRDSGRVTPALVDQYLEELS